MALKLEAKALNGSDPSILQHQTHHHTLLFAITDNNNQRITYFACFLLYAFPYASKESMPQNLESPFLNSIGNVYVH